MSNTKTISTLERARDAFEDIKTALETKTGSSLDNVVVENYPNNILNIPSGGSGNKNYASVYYTNNGMIIDFDNYSETVLTDEVRLYTDSNNGYIFDSFYNTTYVVINGVIYSFYYDYNTQGYLIQRLVAIDGAQGIHGEIGNSSLFISFIQSSRKLLFITTDSTTNNQYISYIGLDSEQQDYLVPTELGLIDSAASYCPGSAVTDSTAAGVYIYKKNTGVFLIDLSTLSATKVVDSFGTCEVIRGFYSDDYTNSIYYLTNEDTMITINLADYTTVEATDIGFVLYDDEDPSRINGYYGAVKTRTYSGVGICAINYINVLNETVESIGYFHGNLDSQYIVHDGNVFEIQYDDLGEVTRINQRSHMIDMINSYIIVPNNIYNKSDFTIETNNEAYVITDQLKISGYTIINFSKFNTRFIAYDDNSVIACNIIDNKYLAIPGTKVNGVVVQTKEVRELPTDLETGSYIPIIVEKI